MARIGIVWCRLMHNEPMWPVHGWYECRTCGRHHRAWRDEQATPGAPSLRQLNRRANVTSLRPAPSAPKYFGE